MRLAGLLLAFSSLPFSHLPREPQKRQPSPLAQPYYVADQVRLIEPRNLDFISIESAAPVLDEAQTRLYVSTHEGRVLCRFHDRTQWSWETPGGVLASPAIDGETLYVPGADGRFTALNRVSGEVKWQFDVHEELTTTPTIAEGRAFVMSSDEAVTALDLSQNGKSLWKFRRDRPGGFTLRGNAQPQVAHGLVFTGFADGTVAALRPNDGVPRWTHNVSGTGDYLDVDAIVAPEDDSRVYAASAKTGITALLVDSGAVAWTVELPGANHLAVDGPRLYASGRGTIVALDRRTGTVLWRTLLPKEQYGTQPSPVDGLVLVAQDRGPLLVLGARRGEVLGSLDVGSGFSQGPLTVPGAAYILSNAGSLYSLGLFGSNR